MINKLKNNKLFRKLDKRSSGLFLMIGFVILLLSTANWHFELKPRLENEAIMNIQIMSASRAKEIESLFQNIQGDIEYSHIHNAINELLLLIDPESKQNLYIGIELEVDYDAIRISPDSFNILAGDTQCQKCIKTENPIYNQQTGELIAIIRIYSNPFFYDRLLKDIGQQLLLVVIAVLIILLIAWYLTNRLLGRLHEREINLKYEIYERKEMEEKLHRIATYDQLTNLPNRYLLHVEFNKKLEEAQRSGKKLAVLFFDLDHFKTINDIYGHETGDLLLKMVTERVSGLLRSYDLFARFGGDEFVMIMPNLNNASEVFAVVEKIIESFKKEYDLGEALVQVSTSIGISLYPQDGNNASVLLKNADLAMYRAKTEGRNGFNFFTHNMNEDLKRAQWIENSLRHALELNQLRLYFQPQQDVKTGKVNSCEALLRWPQPDGSFIGPDEFIPVAERSGLIKDIGNWVFDKACNYQKNWREKGLDTVRIDINLSSREFLGNRAIHQLLESINDHTLVSSHIGIEITENILLDSNQEIREILTQLHRAGVHISIDDFGTGYSSMNYLKQFPVSSIKIDQGFVREAPNNLQDQVIMRAITSVGHGLGMHVIAEGVESEAHYQLVKEMGCDSIQGYYLSKPIPAELFEVQFLIPPDSKKTSNPPQSLS